MSLSHDEQRLVRQIQSGDKDAFRLMYDCLAPYVYTLVYRILGRVPEAEEITQDVFLIVWRKIEKFESRSSLKSWLYRIAVREAWGYLRKKQSVVWTNEDYSAALPAREEPLLKLELEEAITQLPLGARMVFVLHDVEGYKHEEIGDLLGIAVGTSKAQLRRARNLLKEVLI